LISKQTTSKGGIHKKRRSIINKAGLSGLGLTAKITAIGAVGVFVRPGCASRRQQTLPGKY